MEVRLAILFWFYKDVDVCKNRLEILGKLNPEIPIYGLFGGPKEDEKEFQRILDPYLSNFYSIPEQDPFQKWIHGDLYILDWFIQSGKYLNWDSLVIVQWDLIVFESFTTLFSDLKKDHLFLHPLQEIEGLFEKQWYWTSRESYRKIGPKDPVRPFLRNNFRRFKRIVRKKYGYKGTIPRTIFILAILSRKFLEIYERIDKVDVGFLEYKIPTYARIFNIPIYSFDLGENIEIPLDKRPLNARSHEISTQYIMEELSKKDGWRIFHPYYRPFDFDSSLFYTQ